jgi:NTP pyrophosphatase (non-canonical NTP hydrolase)
VGNPLTNIKEFWRKMKMNCVCCGATLLTESGRIVCRQCEEGQTVREFTVETVCELMLEKFGEDSQIDVCIEEMSELTKELIKYKRSKLHFREKEATSREHVVEEISDVLFMVEYLKIIFGISELEIEKKIVEKAKRTKWRYIDQ